VLGGTAHVVVIARDRKISFRMLNEIFHDPRLGVIVLPTSERVHTGIAVIAASLEGCVCALYCCAFVGTDMLFLPRWTSAPDGLPHHRRAEATQTAHYF
jgi:hypothetical protein